jgi:hypothetical protein
MHKRTRARQFIAWILLATCSAISLAATGQELESGLVNALELKKGTTERAGNSGKALQAYMREGLINKKPNRRADYTDYYLLNKLTTFMGHELLVIEEEYMTRHIGCCVSPGAGVTVKVSGSTKNLENFASKNKCAFTDNVDLQSELSSVGLKTSRAKGHYASLSCRERDATREP